MLLSAAAPGPSASRRSKRSQTVQQAASALSLLAALGPGLLILDVTVAGGDLEVAHLLPLARRRLVLRSRHAQVLEHQALVGVRRARTHQTRVHRPSHVLVHRLALVLPEGDGHERAAKGRGAPPAHVPKAVGAVLFEHPDLAVRRIPNLLKLLHRPPEVAHAEDTHEEAMRHEHIVLDRLRRRSRPLHKGVERRPEVGDAVVDVGPGLAVWEAVVEAAKALSLLEDLLHAGRVLEVAKVLFA
mmetsp:Transcript_19059/g.41189  ORF Transcript_19059/g.41189 Transcript_19059/m.41189 type:complete len:243 (-) Transcript_19059:1068-1796(-)